MKRILVGLTTLLLSAVVPAAADAAMGAAPSLPSVPVLSGPRTAAPVVLTGKQLPALSAPAPVPLRALYTDTEDRASFVPPDSSAGANVATDSLAVFAWRDGGFVEMPAQVDERFWRFLSNPGGESGELSGFDTELGYVFDTEGFRRTAGICYASFPDGPVTTPDPVSGFDDDDELAFMARDAGAAAPANATPVTGRVAYEVAITDPGTSQQLFAYVVLAPGRTHTFGAGYVSYSRDEYADRYLGARGGEGIPDGTRCTGADSANDDGSGPVVASTGPRRPRDVATFASDRYSFHFGGRWKPDGLQVADPAGDYGIDLLDQWKGRAFQQAPEQAVSIGFIGEKAWEESSVLLGERVGPIRAMRETWGAKSGTNITRLFTMYDRFLTDTINLRVHPIPPDGVYSMWDHNKGAVSTYYSPMVPAGVPIDGQNDEALGNLDVGVGTPAESHYDIADPTTQPYSAVEQWEEVAGENGSVVYYTRTPRPTAALITSYYRDDANFDDGSGADPATRQGSFGTHGLHIYATADTDNTPFGFAADELQVVTSQYPLVGDAGNVGEAYAAVERRPLTVATALWAAADAPTEDPSAGSVELPLSWGSDEAASNPPAPIEEVVVGAVTTLPGSVGASDPVLATDAEGGSYDRSAPVAGLVQSGSPRLAAGRFNSGVEGATLMLAYPTAGGIVISRSLDGGLSFPQRVLAAAGDTACADTLGSGLTFTTVPVSTGGATWSVPLAVGEAARAVAASFTANGALAVAQSSSTGTGGQAVVSLSGDSSGKFRAVWQQVDAAGTQLRTARFG